MDAETTGMDLFFNEEDEMEVVGGTEVSCKVDGEGLLECTAGDGDGGLVWCDGEGTVGFAVGVPDGCVEVGFVVVYAS